MNAIAENEDLGRRKEVNAKSDPVVHLGREAAQVIIAMEELEESARRERKRGYSGAIQDAARDRLGEKLSQIEKAIMSLHARSIEGALLQLIHAVATADAIRDDEPEGNDNPWQSARIDRLAYALRSAIAALNEHSPGTFESGAGEYYVGPLVAG